MKHTINMMSSSDKVKGQGVLSAYEEQVDLVKRGLQDKFIVSEHKLLKADITHYHTVDFKHYISLPFAKKDGVTVGYVHFLPETMDGSLDLPKPIKKIFYKYLISFYKHMDHLVTVNPYFIERLALYGIPKEQVTYIPNYVDDQKFYPLGLREKVKLREKYNLKSDKFTVVCAGQLQTRKGVFDFVKCAKALPEMQFLWAGGFSFGYISDGYSEIKEIVEHPPENLIFTGIIDREEMNEIYNLGDVMFLPSYEELFPMTILEAMNCRIPILLRDIDLYKNILFDFYIKETDLEGFKNALVRLKEDHEYYHEYCEKAWDGHRFYNKEHVLSMWENFYTGIVEPPLSSARKRKSAKPKTTKHKRG